MQQTTQQKPPALKFLVIISIATAVILVLTITPWNIVPTPVTEDVQVIATTEFGCVGESSEFLGLFGVFGQKIRTL